ncbi:hypothetical protein GCM10009081_13020 [Brevundimonas nasdae]
MEALSTELGVAEKIVWPGMLKGDAKWGAYRNAAAFVLPSHGENFGIVVAEALACATPVLISDKVNIWQDVKAADAGRVAANTTEATEIMLRSFLALSDDEQKACGVAGRQLFLQKFDIENSAKDIVDALS